MTFENQQIADVFDQLVADMQAADDKASILKSGALKGLYAQIPQLPEQQRAAFGKEINQLKQELERRIDAAADEQSELPPIDVTSTQDVNADVPALLPKSQGSKHPLTSEIETMLDIFYRMGFTAVESREIDDDFHMFEALNFPAEHPARDNFDTFMTTQTDSNGVQFIAPAHTSTMQHRVLKDGLEDLHNGTPIATVIPGRVFRNEDLDARHEHTFYQLEGVYVDKGVTVGNLIATLRAFLQAYYQKDLKFKTQPFYFPFTEPSFEFAISCPFCDQAGCKVCSQSGWIELLGCGMIHPNVLRHAGIDPNEYTGFAWGVGVDRLVMMKYGIEDVRHFESGKLAFLRQF